MDPEAVLAVEKSTSLSDAVLDLVDFDSLRSYACRNAIWAGASIFFIISTVGVWQTPNGGAERG